jgi:hypothetical protein
MASLLSGQTVVVVAFLEWLYGCPFGHWFPREYVSVSPKEIDEHAFLFIA